MTNAPRRAALYTLGCRLNQSETAILEQQLIQAGYTIVPFHESADLGIINTCTVTGEADAKSRKMIRSFVRRNPDAFVAVVGCYAQLGHGALADIDGVDLVIGNTDKLRLLDHIEQAKQAAPKVIVDDLPPDDFVLDAFAAPGHATRANLKIQDGCNFMCSYCIVPYARGRSRSRQMDNLLDEARFLVDHGVKEIVLNGINLGTYDNEGRGIDEVVNRLNTIPGLRRIRISSIDVTTIPEALLAMMADPNHALTPFLHIPLQSGSDAVLKRMNRKYTRNGFIDLIERAARSVPNLCIGTDVLVGFPGETDDDFADTCSIIADHPVTYAHVFKYSDRKGAPAERMGPKVAPAVAARRSEQVRASSAKKLDAFQRSFAGTTAEVLFEQQDKGLWTGYTMNYIRVAVCSSDQLSNTIRTVRLEAAQGDRMTGSLIDD